MIRLKIKEILDKMYSDDIITNVTYVTILQQLQKTRKHKGGSLWIRFLKKECSWLV